MSATLPCVMGHIQGMCFSFVIRRCLCYPSRDFPVPVYLFVVMLDGGSGSRMPFVICLVIVRSLPFISAARGISLFYCLKKGGMCIVIGWGVSFY